MSISTDPDSVFIPSWDSSQLHMRTWLDDLAVWLPTQQSDFATLVEQGFIITSQGKVATYDMDHALACRSRLQTVYSFDNPSPRVPSFAFATATAPQPAASG
eukprot:6177749-Pleurochrysis_carterae.AAC.1